eukprot:3834072-Pleurochrysis_carterae.AAC.2
MDKLPAAKTYDNAFFAEMSPVRGGRLHSVESDTDETVHKPPHRSAEITSACKSTSSASPSTGLCVVPSSSCQRSNGLFIGPMSTNPDEVARVLLLLVDVADLIYKKLKIVKVSDLAHTPPTTAAAVAAAAVAVVGGGGSAEALSTSCTSAHVYRSAKYTPSFLKAAPPKLQAASPSPT